MLAILFRRLGRDSASLSISLSLSGAALLGVSVVAIAWSTKLAIILVVGLSAALFLALSPRGTRGAAASTLFLAVFPDSPSVGHIATFIITPRDIALLFALLMVLGSGKVPVLKRSSFRRTWLVWFIIVVVGALANHRPQAVPEFVVFLPLPFLLGSILGSTPSGAVGALRGLIAGTLVLVMEGFSEFLMHRNLFPPAVHGLVRFVRAGNTQAAAGWQHPLALGMFLCTVAFIVIDRAARRGLPLAIVATLFLAGGVFVTEERSPLLGFGAGLLVYLLLQRAVRYRIRVLAVMLAGSVGIAAFPGSGANLFRRFLSSSISSGSASGIDVTGRLILLRLAWSAIKHNPLTGYSYGVIENTQAVGRLSSYLVFRGSLYSDIADFPLGIAVDTGLLGLAALVVVLAGTVLILLRARREVGTGPYAGLCAGVVAGFVASLGTSAQSSAMMLLFVCGLSVSMARMSMGIPGTENVGI